MFRICLFVWSGSAQDKLAEPSYNNEALKDVTEYRLRHRRTIDGRLCAAAFVQDQETFTDCTTTKDPSGTSGQEWCYVEVQLLGKDPSLPNWNFCQPYIDYDLIRHRTNQVLDGYAEQIRHTTKRLVSEKHRLDETISLFENVCGRRHDDIAKRFDKLGEQQKRVGRLLQTVKEAEKTLAAQEAEGIAAQQELEALQLEALRQPENCSLTETSDMIPGLLASYWDNSHFKGEPVVSRVDPEINYTWTSQGPSESLGPFRYSAQWTGFIQVFVSGRYKFIINCDGGARLSIDNVSILVDRMPYPSPGNGLTVDEDLTLTEDAGQGGVRESRSLDTEMVAGKSYPITLQYFHHHALTFADGERGVVQLKWVPPTGNREPQIIPSEFLSTSDFRTPLGISGLDLSRSVTDRLSNGRYAFIDSSHDFIADLPREYRGALWIKYSRGSLTNIKLNFSISAPGELLLAIPLDGELPVASSGDFSIQFRETGDIFSIYKSENRHSTATSSIHLKIFAAMINEAWHPIRLVLKDVQRHPTLVMVKEVKERKTSGATCQQTIWVVSNPSLPIFDNCTESSAENDDRGCLAAFDPSANDAAGRMWRTADAENAIGSWLEITWKKPVKLSALEFIPPASTLAWPSRLRLDFSTPEGFGNSYPELEFGVNKSNTLFKSHFDLRGRVVEKLRITVDDLSASARQTGGGFKLFGSECERDNQKHADVNEKQINGNEILLQSCVESFKDFPLMEAALIASSGEGMVDALTMETTRALRFSCPRSCFTTYEKEPPAVFGSSLYGPNSAICGAALHSGVCTKSANGSLCKFVGEIGPPRNFLHATFDNGVLSKDQSDAVFTVRLFEVKDKKPSLVRDALIDFIGADQKNGESKTGTGVFRDSGSKIGIHKGSGGMRLEFGWIVAQAEDSDVIDYCGTTGGSDGITMTRADERHEASVWTVTTGMRADIQIVYGHPCALGADAEPIQGRLMVDGKPISATVELAPGQFRLSDKISSEGDVVIQFEGVGSSDHNLGFTLRRIAFSRENNKHI